MPLSWINPRTWVNGVDVSDTMLNEISNDLNWLYSQPTFQVKFASTPQSIPNATPTVIKFDSVDRDTNSGYSASTGLYTVPTGCGGNWVITAYQQYASNATGYRSISLTTSGGTLQPTSFVSAAIDALGRCTVTLGPIYIADGTTIQVTTNQTSTAPLNLGTGYTCAFSGQRIGA